MSTIRKDKELFEEANRECEKDDLRMLTLKKEMKELKKKTEIDRNNRITRGMIYYSAERRKELLDKADELKYSRKTIERLRNIDDRQWNSDLVDNDLISEFQTIEKYIGNFSQKKSKSPFSILGKFINEAR